MKKRAAGQHSRRQQRFSLKRFPLENKTVLLRVDYNVPLKKGQVADNRRIKASLPTIRFLLQKNCKIILATHRGRPEGKKRKKWRLEPVAQELKKLLPKEKITKLDDSVGREIEKKIKKETPRQIFLLENLRCYKEEEQNESLFARQLAALADVFVNDAFGVAHRKHASVEAITHFLPAMPGLLLEKEIKQLSKALRPRKPAIWILGGAKLDKIGLMRQALKKADYILMGGALAFSFLKAKGISVGKSKVDEQSVALAKKILKIHVKKIILPVDFMALDHFSEKAEAKKVACDEIQKNQRGLDLGPKTVALFKQYLKPAKTIIWNGPLGYVEWDQFARATKQIGQYLGTLKATSIGAGGETAEALQKCGLTDKMSHVSTGGGAAIAFLSGQKLPALAALEKNYRRFQKKVKK